MVLDTTQTFSRCFSSPEVKLSISSAFLSSTVPFVSVCAMSSPHVKTATFAFFTFVTMPVYPIENTAKQPPKNTHPQVAVRTPSRARPGCRRGSHP